MPPIKIQIAPLIQVTYLKVFFFFLIKSEREQIDLVEKTPFSMTQV